MLMLTTVLTFSQLDKSHSNWEFRVNKNCRNIGFIPTTFWSMAVLGQNIGFLRKIAAVQNSWPQII